MGTTRRPELYANRSVRQITLFPDRAVGPDAAREIARNSRLD